MASGPTNSPEAGAGPLVYIVVGEESGDALGAELVSAIRQLSPRARFAGLAGARMQAQGLASLFDVHEIAVMGLSAVVARLPTLLFKIAQTANDVLRQKPDVLVLIDTPEFSRRVARRVRKANPDIPIVKYVCPSVWAWRPGRARVLARCVDHVLALLPFEPALLAELGGPPATYVGHPLARRIGALAPASRRRPSAEPVLLVLPGSRRSVVRTLAPDIRRTLEIFLARGNRARILLPTVPRLADEIRRITADWPIRPEVIVDDREKEKAFASADAALAASGTVLLELGLFRVPTISIYRLDWLMHRVRHLITGWSAALPNLIADEAVVPERIGDMVRPGWIARALEGLLREGPERDAQLAGFEKMAAAMAATEPPGTIAARKVLEFAIARRNA
jgi:lipid-A-disaccharide synthase